MRLRRELAILPWAVLLVACAVNPPRLLHNPAADHCLELYAALDAVMVEHGVTPSSSARIPDFPYLRVDRFLSSYREQALNPAETAAWLARLNGLDREARRIEWDSLPDSVQTPLNRRHAPTSEVPAVLERCATTLRIIDLADAERLALIRQRAQVADDYHTVHQVLGLYPLTALPVDFGIYRAQEETRALFAQPLATLPVQGALRRFGLDPALPVPMNPADIARDALNIPEPTPAQIEALFTAHAPLWEIDVATDADRPGTPYWRVDGIPTVNPADPTVYRYVSYARWRGEPLLQLNYLIWFAARPRTGAFDLLGGPLDGVLWRVTLDRSGQALLYDSIHACGCYHQLFPSPALRLQPETAQWAEPPLAPQPAPTLGHGERLILRLSAGSHALQRIYADRPGETIALDGRDYTALYTVPVENGAPRSLFGPDGLVAGSERAERWWLWPMGVLSAGAMRERGRHAIAFVGRRHFDDADLLDRLFQPTQEEP
ncbi:MAG: hypothetical protein IPL99_01990 [Candidatus Competibacteraceae bacterium]|nr:hypothetical protein [Candidatus Competibacteraceae bacterium]